MIAPAYVRRMLDYWRLHNIPFLPGLTADELRQMEGILKVDLPEQMRIFYSYTDGNDVPDSAAVDEHGYRFLRLQNLIRGTIEPWLLTFCDFMDGVGFYAIDLGGGAGYGRGSVYLFQDEAVIVATSFDEFTKLYVGGDSRLTPDGAEEYRRRLMRVRERPARD